MLGPMRDDIRESLVSQIPFPKRLGRAEDFAALVEHILENEYERRGHPIGWRLAHGTALIAQVRHPQERMPIAQNP